MRKIETAILMAFVAILCVVPATAQESGEAVAAEGPRAFVSKVDIVFDGKARFDGIAKLKVMINQGETFDVEVGVVKKMKGKDIARDLAKEMELAFGAHLKIKAKGQRIEIGVPKGKKGTTFHIAVTNWNLLGVSLKME